MHCPVDGEELVHTKSDFETIGEGWNRHLALYEDSLCPKCGLRVRQYFRVMNLGGGKTIDNEASKVFKT